MKFRLEPYIQVIENSHRWKSKDQIQGLLYGTRCRPWESAINLEALIDWALKQK